LADDIVTVEGTSMHGAEGLLTTADLAARPSFHLGKALIDPSTRSISGPGGTTVVEPRVMQVLVVLAEAAGSVVTRDTLFNRCWGGVYVGDDSLNRAVASVRRIAAEIARGSFTLETIPRTGYRLVAPQKAAAEPVPEAGPDSPDEASDRAARPSRRLVVTGGLVAATVGAVGLWSALPPSVDPRVTELLDHGRQALRDELPDRDRQGLGFFRRAVAIDPDNAAAWGLLTLALRNVAENAPPAETTAAIHACEAAARRALALDPREGNALAALATLRPYFGDWVAAENRLRKVLAVAPDNTAAISHLVTLLQSVGRARDSWLLNERAAALDLLSPVPQFRRAFKFWIFGRVPQADLTIDRALQLWPRHPAVWNARLLIFAFTGRARAALAMLDDQEARPAKLPEPAIDLWRLSLAALETRDSRDVAAALKANVEAAPRSPGFAQNAIMVLPMLGEVDAAFDVANGFFLRRGRLIGTLWTGDDQMPVNDLAWRRTMPLFTPAAAPLRADRRFLDLCEGMGLGDYWRRRGIRPDPFLLRIT
jgi:DNA-binding winged helix-turn-helix (wHTH) protein